MGLIFECRYCEFSTPQFKILIEHYVNNHQGKGLKQYKIRHRIKGDSAILTSPSAQEACEANNWLIGDCYIQEIK